MRLAPWVRGLLAVTALRAALAAFLPVTPEEAYHWDWGRHLDWSYYDHPGMIAWSIRLGCLLFGDTALGIRFMPVLFSVGTTVIVARLARRVGGEAAAGWAVLLLALEPLLSIGGYPDSPLLFFWAFAMACVFEALETGRGPMWIAAGLALGGMGLSKYTGALFGLAVLLHLVTSERDRRWLATPWPYAAAVVALVVMAPVFYWNAHHDWISFKFQGGERIRESRPMTGGGFGYLVQQAIVVVPFTIPLAVVAVVKAWRSHRFFFWCFATMVGFFFIVAWVRMVHVLWPLPAFLSLTVVMAGSIAGVEGRIARWYGLRWKVIAGAALSALAAAIVHVFIFLPWLSPAMPDLYGWDEAARRAKELRSGMGEGTFYLGLGRKYVCPSELAFKLDAPFDVEGKNLIGDEGLQFAYWADLKALAGRDAVVVLQDGDRTSYSVEITRARFDSVEPAGELVVPVGRRPIRPEPPLKFLFFRARGFRPIKKAP